MAFKHGVYASQKETSVSTPVEAASGVPFVVGRSPVHSVGGKVNQPILCNTYSEAVEAFGYSDDWEKYELCEMIYSHFKLFGMTPVVMVNVLDPEAHKASEAAADAALVNKQIHLPFEAMKEGLVVQSPADLFSATLQLSNGAGSKAGLNLNADTLMVYTDGSKQTQCAEGTDYTYTYNDGIVAITAVPDGQLTDSCYIECSRTNPVGYTVDTDYTVFYDGSSLIVEILEGGAIPANADALNVAYAKVDPSLVTRDDVIGGYDPNTGAYSGLELIEQVYPKYRLAPDLILCPGWSTNSGVAAAMAAKAANINGLFLAKALIDADCSTVKSYTDVTAWKSDNNINGVNQILFWPMVSLDGRKYHLSVQAAGRMAATDADNDDCPCESPSNKGLQCDSIILADGTEVNLSITQANYLNSVGVATAINFSNGFVLWGNYTACYPSNTDVKDYFIPVSRMFGWVSSSVIQTYWSKTDRKLTRRLIDSVIDSVNIWLNGLTAEEKLLGGRCEFLADENSTTDLMAGIMKFHIYMTPPSPAQEIDFILEYDVNYVTAALT